ncbi:hypothetical protein [Accumulibacter sp.]|uniref:hypothetical protein n=1 Tax=Accumulibacter sp. TaxID=2053492 RepID=UPI0025E5B8BA|nr:hypothetical protein [Accumulibacter sp.]MCM8627082.1 hypothetical protein [Accumulibacter sp.]
MTGSQTQGGRPATLASLAAELARRQGGNCRALFERSGQRKESLRVERTPLPEDCECMTREVGEAPPKAGDRNARSQI